MAGLAVVSLFGVLFALAAFQTKLAQDQLELDRLQREIRSAQLDYERLRGEVARLEAPESIVAAAQALGLVPPDPAAITYVTPTPQAVAALAVVTGEPGAVGPGGGPATPTDDWSAVKPIVGGAP